MKQNMIRAKALVDLSRLKHNVDSIKKIVSKDTTLMLVVKANAYGHGALQVAKSVEDIEFVKYLGVATDDEALALRKNGIRKDILILGYEFSKDYKPLIENNISFCVFDYDSALEISQVAKQLNKIARIHIKIDTGMSRIGFFNKPEHIEIIKRICNLDNIAAEGIFTHFARADEEDRNITNRQIEDFNNCIDKLHSQGIDFNIIHSSNSAGILQYPEANMNMVRGGGLVYGLSPSLYMSKMMHDILPVMSIESTVIFVKTIDKGRQISYGGTYIAPRDMKIATVPIGYGDGYPRSISNKGSVLIGGQRCQVVGRVCMDQFMVDVTDLKDIKIGDRVILLGDDGNDRITMDEWSIWSDRLNYEIICNIGDRVTREYK